VENVRSHWEPGETGAKPPKRYKKHRRFSSHKGAEDIHSKVAKATKTDQEFEEGIDFETTSPHSLAVDDEFLGFRR